MTQSPSSSMRNDVQLLMKLAAPLDFRDFTGEVTSQIQTSKSPATPRSRRKKTREPIEIAPRGTSRDWFQINITSAISNIGRSSPWAQGGVAASPAQAGAASAPASGSTPVSAAPAVSGEGPPKQPESRSPLRTALSGLFQQRPSPDGEPASSRGPPLHPATLAPSSAPSAFQPSSVVVRLASRGESQDSPAW